jgi:hypothetical protein
MANSNVPMFIQTIKSWVTQILPADTTTLKTLVTGGSQGSKVEQLFVTSTDTSARDMALWWTISATNYLIGTISIPITAGFTNAIPTVNILRNAQIPAIEIDANGNPFIYVGSGAVLAVSTLTTVTTAKAIQFIAQGGDF